MTPENFVYWLQGWLEIQKPMAINEEQTQEIKNHLALVLRKETPTQGERKFLNDNYPYISREQTWPQTLQGTGISPFFKDNPFHINMNGQIVPGSATFPETRITNSESGNLEEYYKTNGFYPPGCNIRPFGPVNNAGLVTVMNTASC